jgi:hypothetical protein
MAAPASAAPDTPAALPCVEVARDAVTGAVRAARDCRSRLVDRDAPEETARAFLRSHQDGLGMPFDLASLRLLTIRHGLDSSHVLYQQTYAGLRVMGAYVGVHFDRTGQVQVLQNGYVPGLDVDVTVATVSASKAVELARQAIEFVQPRGKSPEPELVILPQLGGGRLIWQVTLLAAEPQGDWEVLIDAVTTEVIKRYNRLTLARAQVFAPNPAQQSGRTAGDGRAWTELQTVELEGLDGSGWLRGEYVDVTFPVGHLAATAHAPDGNFVYLPNDPRFEEVMVYYHIDSTQRYIQSLGYSDRNSPANGIRDRVTYASPHWFAEDQSFYSISDDALHFGDGGIQDAEDADVIVHEYAHALHHDQLACWGGGQMEAIGEGFGDYLAASRFASVGTDPACIAEWDSQGYAATSASCLRRVDRHPQNPVDIEGDAHADGAVWSGVLWSLRSEIGPRLADTLALETNFYLPCGATLEDAGRALLDADRNLTSGRHAEAIENILATHGLRPLLPPLLTSPAGSTFLSPGSPAVIAWSVAQELAAVYDAQYSFNPTAVGVRQDAFADGQLPAGYESFGNVPWEASEGAARSGAIRHAQSSSLALAFELVRSAEVGFRFRVSSEEGWDLLEVLLDGQAILQASGERDWADFRVTVQPGPHTLVWRYRKDSTVSSGGDTAWIDDVRLPNVSTATWIAVQQPASGAQGRLIWRVPDSSTGSAKVRLRARVGEVTSPWAVSPGTILIGEPTAVRLDSFEAGSHPSSTGSWKVGWAVAGAGALGIAWTLGWGLRRRRAR